MHDPLHRLYRTKLVLLATVLLAVGLTLLVIGRSIGHNSWRWLSDLPITDIGSGLFTTGLLGVAWQYVDGQDSEVRDTERLKRVLADSAPAMRDAVIQGFAFEPDDLARVATPETLDQIITNGLALRLGDAGFADEIYDDLRTQAIGNPERLHDARVSIRLSPLHAGRGTGSARAPLFAVLMRWEYELIPAYATRRFVCTSDIREYRELAQDNAGTAVWYIPPSTNVDASRKESFELLDFSLDGASRPIRRSAKSDSQTYSVNLGHEAMSTSKLVSASYTYRTVIAADGNRLRLRVDQPTKGLSVSVDYSDTDITDLAVLDYIASGERTRTSRSPADGPGKAVTLEFDGWIFPRSGVAFVWRRDN